jgi:hypothetical protein
MEVAAIRNPTVFENVLVDGRDQALGRGGIADRGVVLVFGIFELGRLAQLQRNGIVRRTTAGSTSRHMLALRERWEISAAASRS